jgi:hypothetical protein
MIIQQQKRGVKNVLHDPRGRRVFSRCRLYGLYRVGRNAFILIYRRKRTMLKTNSKQAKENIKQYIMDRFSPEGYTETPPQEWPEIAAFILETFRSEKYHLKEDFRYYNNCELDAFTDWAQGLPSLLDTCYYYNRSAVDDLAVILEETETEKARFTDQDAEQLLTALIYRELTRGCK